MNINATFLIQIIHFLIAYKMLNALLFRPAIASLKEKRDKRKQIETAIKQEEETLLSLEKEKTEQIVTFQAHVKKQYPFVTPLPHEEVIETARTVPEEVDIKQVKQELVDLLVTKVPDVY